MADWERVPDADLPAGVIDRRTGAPHAARRDVGIARTEPDRLAALRRYYPDARPYGDGNFVYTNPETGRPTLYNAPGFSLGDVTSILPEIAEAGGAGIGAAAGTMAGGPVGTAVGAGLGATAGRETYERLNRAIFGIPDSRGVGQQAGDMAFTGGINAVVPEAVNRLGRGVKSMFGSANRAIFGNRGAPAVLDDYAQAGVRPDAASVTGNPITGGVQRSSSTLIGGMGPARNLFEGQAADVGRGVGEVAQQTAEEAGRLARNAPVPAQRGMTPGQQPSQRLQDRVARQQANAGSGPTNPLVTGLAEAPGREEAGHIVQQGARRATGRIDARIEDLESEATRLIGADRPVTTPAVDALRRRIEREMAQAPASRTRVLQPVLDWIDRLQDDVGSGLGYEALRRIRTDLRHTIQAPHNPAAPIASAAEPLFNRLYGAMTDDLLSAARSAGPDAERAFRLATRYNRLNSTVNLPALEAVLDKGTDQQIFRLILPESGRPNFQAAERILRNLQPAERRAVGAAILDHMGTPPPSAQVGGYDFSIDTFLTNWAKLAGEGTPARARAILIGDQNSPELAAQLDRLLRVSARIKDYGQGRNWSNTAGAALGGGSILAATANLLSGDILGAVQWVVGPVASGYLAMRAMTNPRFVRWLADTAPQAARDGTISGNAMRALGAAAASDRTLRPIYEAYRDSFGTPGPAGNQQRARQQ